MKDSSTIQSDAAGLRVGLVWSRYHRWATDRLVAGAREEWVHHGGDPTALVELEVPGSWELLAGSTAMLNQGGFDGVVAIGVVIRGETPHFDYICEGVAHGLAELAVRSGIPVGFGVLTCDSAEQVEARSGGDVGNKGAEALTAVVATIRSINKFMVVQDGCRG